MDRFKFTSKRQGLLSRTVGKVLRFPKFEVRTLTIGEKRNSWAHSLRQFKRGTDVNDYDNGQGGKLASELA